MTGKRLSLPALSSSSSYGRIRNERPYELTEREAAALRYLTERIVFEDALGTRSLMLPSDLPRKAREIEDGVYKVQS